MATRTITSVNTALLSALSGALSAGDTVYLDNYSTDYASADLSGTDLAAVKLTAGCGSRFAADTTAQLKLTCDRTSTGVFTNEGRCPYLEVVSTGPTGVIYEVRQAPQFAGRTLFDNCKVTKLYQTTPGSTRIGANCDLAASYWTSGTFEIQASTGGSYVLTDLYIGGDASGVVRRDLANIYGVGPGTLRLDSTTITPSGVITLGGMTLVVVASGTIPTLQGSAGIVDFTQLRTPVTVSARLCGPGVSILYSKSSKGMVTWSDTSGDYGGGPREVVV